MVNRIESHPEASGLPRLPLLLAAADARDADKVVLGEDGVVVGQERGALPLREVRGEEGAGGVAAAVEAEADGGGAGVVGVLDQLLEHGGAFRVVDQDLPDPPGQIHLLPEVLQQGLIHWGWEDFLT